MIGIEHVNHARHARLIRPAPRIAGERDTARRGAVIRTVAGENLLPPSDEACDLDGILIGFCPTVGKEKYVDVTRCDLGEFGA